MKTALVTGGSRGIGAAIVDRLIAKGWRVIVLSRSKPREGVQHVACDFSQPVEVEKAAKLLLKQVASIDLIVCAAGVGRFVAAEGFSVTQIEEVLRVNFTSHAVLLGQLVPMMKQARQGKIIVIGSEAAVQGARLGSIYCASKFALRGYCQALRAECRSAGVAVTLVNPGLTRSDFYANLTFEPAVAAENCLAVEDVCACVMLAIELPNQAVAEEIQLQPMKPQVVKKDR